MYGIYPKKLPNYSHYFGIDFPHPRKPEVGENGVANETQL